MKFILIILFAMLWNNLHMNSAESNFSSHEIGGGFHYLIHFHKSEFTKLYNIDNCCPNFNEGDGTGYSPFFFYGYKLFENVSIETRFGFSMSQNLFLSTEATNISVENEVLVPEFEHRLETDIQRVSLQPMIAFSLFSNLNFKAGMDLKYFLIGDYYQVERIKSDILTFVDSKSRERNQSEGAIPKLINFQMAAITGLSYDFPLNSSGTLMLSPEVLFSYGFTEVVEETEWKTNTLFAGISIKYNPLIKIRNPITPPHPPPPPPLPLALIPPPPAVTKEPVIAKVLLSPSVSAKGVESGHEVEVATMVIEEFLSISMRPLLNYIFFDQHSSEIPDRYESLSKESSQSFTIGNLSKLSTLSTYHNILNIVGLRLKENPGTNISLIGCNSYNEKKRRTLSRKRSNNVKSYLTKVWGISSNRIKTSSRNLPKNQSNNSNLDGQQENRRTEIHFDSWEIMKPIVAEDTLKKVSPPIIRFYPKVESDNDISEWKLSAEQNGKVLTVFSGKDSVPQKIEWFIDRDKETIPNFEGQIEYTLEVKDNKGNESVSNKEILPLDMVTIQKKKENRVGDERIDRYSLILFEFDSDELGGSNMQIIEFITGKLQDNSKLVVSGYSDRMGATDLNSKLSKKRAEKVARALNRIEAETRGVGESMLLYENDYPEGRFYCRTVEVKVRTPITWKK